MTTPLTAGPALTFIPAELCTLVGQAPDAPPQQCVDLAVADVADDGVAAPSADLAALREVVADAADRGVDLKIVVLRDSPPRDEPLRDIATDINAAFPDSTVLVLSPGLAGVSSPAFDRATLEEAQDVAKTDDPVVASRDFLAVLTAPNFPYTGFTVALVVLVAAAVAGTRALQGRARRTPAASPEPGAPAASADAS